MDSIEQQAGTIANRKSDWELKIRIIAVIAALIVIVVLAMGLISQVFILMLHGLLGLVVVLPMLGGLLLLFRKLVAGYVLGVPVNTRTARPATIVQVHQNRD